MLYESTLNALYWCFMTTSFKLLGLCLLRSFKLSSKSGIHSRCSRYSRPKSKSYVWSKFNGASTLEAMVSSCTELLSQQEGVEKLGIYWCIGRYCRPDQLKNSYWS
jgi:hypothetical protein